MASLGCSAKSVVCSFPVGAGVGGRRTVLLGLASEPVWTPGRGGSAVLPLHMCCPPPNPHLRICLLILERGGERNIHQLPPICAPTGD